MTDALKLRLVLGVRLDAEAGRQDELADRGAEAGQEGVEGLWPPAGGGLEVSVLWYVVWVNWVRVKGKGKGKGREGEGSGVLFFLRRWFGLFLSLSSFLSFFLTLPLFSLSLRAHSFLPFFTAPPFKKKSKKSSEETHIIAPQDAIPKLQPADQDQERQKGIHQLHALRRRLEVLAPEAREDLLRRLVAR